MRIRTAVALSLLLALMSWTADAHARRSAKCSFDFALTKGKTLRMTTSYFTESGKVGVGIGTMGGTVVYSLRITAGGVIGRDRIRARARMVKVSANHRRGNKSHSWNSKSGGKPDRVLLIPAALHGISFDVTIARNLKITVSKVRPPKLSYTIPQRFLSLYNKAISPASLAAGMHGFLIFLPRGQRRGGEAWTFRQKSSGASPKAKPYSVRWSVKTCKSKRATVVGKMSNVLPAGVNGTIQRNQIRMVFDLVRRRPVSLIVDMAFKMSGGYFAKNHTKTVYSLR